MNWAKWVLAALLVVPASAFAFFKPVRMLLPETFGAHCAQNVCVDDLAKLDIAAAMLNTAKRQLEAQHGLIAGEPRVVFCSTEKCRRTFGVGQRAGFTFAAFGIVIAPRGWKVHYVSHELIHYWQAENFGSLVLLRGEPWLIEGMAYALSNDPRNEIREPFESYRQKFNDWHRQNAGMPVKALFGKAL